MSTDTGTSVAVGHEPFELSAAIVGAESVGTAVDATRHAIETALDDVTVTVWRYPAGDGNPTVVSATVDGPRLPPAVARERKEADGGTAVRDEPGPGGTGVSASRFTGECLFSVDGFGVVGVETARVKELSETDVATARRVVTLLESALDRFDTAGTAPDRPVARRLTNLVTAGEGLSAAVKVLSLVREHLDLRAGALVVDGETDGGFETLVDPTGTYRTSDPTAVAAKLPVGTDPGPTAVTAPTDAPEGVKTYLATPVTVDGRREGTVWFAGETTREGFDEDDRWVLSRLAEWAGNTVERRRRRERHERFEAVLEAVDDPVYALDVDGRFTYVNDAAARAFGHGEDVVGDHVSTVVARADVDRTEGLLQELVETDDRSATVQFELNTEGGGTRVVENNVSMLELSGEVRGTAGVVRDVTAREDQRRWYESFRRAIENAADGVAVLEDEEYVYVDGTHVELYGFDSREQLLGDTWRRLYDGDERARLEAEAFPELESTGHWRGRVTGSRPDGSTFPATLSLTVVDEGRLVCTVQDVTEHETHRRELERRSAAIEASRDGVAILDEQKEYVYVNQAHAEVYGYDDPEVFVGEGWEMCYREDERARIGAEALSALAEEGSWRGAATGVRRDGSTFPQDVSLTRLEDGGIVCVVRDETDREERKRELAEERERFQLLTESVDEYAFVALDEDGVVATWNDGASDLFGYDAETAVGTPLEAFYPTPKRESGVPGRLVQQARIAGESAYEGRHVRADGSTFHADVRYALLETDEGESRGYAMVARDMTERRRQRRRTERFVEESDEVVAVSDPRGTFDYVSGSATRVLGYDPEDLVGQNLFDSVHDDDREEVMETYFGAVDRPDGRARTECRVAAATGEWRSVEVRVRNMCDDGAIGGMLVYLHDVTESKARTRRFESIFNSTYQFTSLLAPDGTIREANDTILDFVGRDREEVVGTPFHEAPWWGTGSDRRERAREAVDRTARGEFVRYETEITGVDRVATVDFSVKPVVDDAGETTALVAEGRDITARQRHRRHMQVLQRVLRHNVRNDVNKLDGWVRMLAETEDPDERATHVETVTEVLEKWSAMTEKVRDIQEVLEAERSLEALADVAALVETVVTSGRWPGKTVEATVEKDLEATVPPSLRKAVTELVDNAVEVGEDPTVGVGATVVETDSGRNWVELSVTDDGPGLPDMEAEVLCEGEETPLGHGAGLGLWMVRMLVKQAGGEVSVDVTDAGTTVRLRLPDGRLPSDRR